jgi:hypothetical protein
MARQFLDIEDDEPMPFHRAQRELREVVVAHQIELVARDRPLEVRELQRGDAVRREQAPDAGDEVVEVADLREDVVADQEICSPAGGHQFRRESAAEECGPRWHALRRGRHIGGRLDAEHRQAQRQDWLQQAAIIATGLDHQRTGAEIEPLPHRLAGDSGMPHPAVRERGEIGEFVEARAGRHVLPKLHELACFAGQDVQREKGFRLIELVGTPKRLARGRHAQVQNLLLQWSRTAAAPD